MPCILTLFVQVYMLSVVNSVKGPLEHGVVAVGSKVEGAKLGRRSRANLGKMVFWFSFQRICLSTLISDIYNVY